ncbi:Uma2 family endonuclease [Streptomyces sp. LP05-1]|uniref:Uma2 family endonuclease n=1 Tax=Streptomyces pyxinae TaxID=2970734 RepID=A0ABT2CJW7_9ACTN|nr:Uma2 family endonuclease [Streptomyces sp. LP05-1]MCS0637704.1 Uma2 family endonuclease [Streptomyces sp. LP05-1]
MSALTVDHSASGQEWDDLVRLWEETDWPEGCKVEIIEGIITVAPPPAYNHARIVACMNRYLVPLLKEGWDLHQTVGIAVVARGGYYIPDLIVIPDAALEGAGEDGEDYAPASVAELVVEVTSPSNAKQDRVEKASGYARSGVPLYLLIDAHARSGPTVTLYGQPKGGLYQVLETGKFGDPITLPEPFSLTIDTGQFPT